MSQVTFNLVKKVVSWFPPTWPAAVYNTLINITFFKYLITSALKRLTPKEGNIPEGKIIFDPEDPIMASWLTLGQYEPEMVAMYRSCLKVGMTVVDIGANLGYFTVISARKVGPTGSVFAYEPDPHNFALLQKNIAINEFKNVKAFAVALSEKSGTRELFFGDNNTTHSFSDKRGKGRFETVATDTLDESLQALGSPRVDIIKMDIEGAEPIALEGMRETLTRNPELIMLFEFYPNAIQRLGSSPIDFLERIKSFGFSISVIEEDSGTLVLVDDIEAFMRTFPKKDSSKNLFAVR